MIAHRLAVVFAVVSLCLTATSADNTNYDQQQHQQQQRQQRDPETSKKSGQAENTDYDDYVPFQGDNQDNFDWALTQRVFLKDPKNLVISPFSIKLLLNLLAEAAGTDTQTQKELAIISSNNIRSPYANRNQFGKIFESLNAPNDNYDFRMGTRVFVDQFVEPLQRYSAIIDRYYNTAIERLDFKDPHVTAQTINDWCANITRGHINKLVEPSDIDNSVMIMLNAIYFQGLWRRPFLRNETVQLPFHLSSTQQMPATYMTRTGYYYYLDSAELNSKILRIPYKGRKFSMLLVVPKSKDGINDFVRQMDATTLRRVEWLMDEHEVKVSIPKFKFDYLANYNEILKELGIHEIFTSEASLPLLARGAGLRNQLHVSGVIQKAGIQVDEQGSTVYAATEVTLINKFGAGTKEFTANVPFLFFIQDETTGTLLFSGKITNPAELEVPA